MLLSPTRRPNSDRDRSSLLTPAPAFNPDKRAAIAIQPGDWTIEAMAPERWRRTE
jgi:hypothetical protein